MHAMKHYPSKAGLIRHNNASHALALAALRWHGYRTAPRIRQGKPNAQLAVSEIDTLCAPDAQGAALLQQVITRLSLSARAYHRVLKVARSIADLAGSENILTAHIAEAVQYRRMGRQI